MFILSVLNLICLSVHFAGGLRGASIIDSLDTLYIMGLMDEYNDAKEWVKTNLELNSVRIPFDSHSTCMVFTFILLLLCWSYFEVSVGHTASLPIDP